MAEMTGPDGPITAGVWHRYNAKSQVWYPKEEFDAAGYAIPETWDDMLALSDQIVADGDKPWCVGIESGAATGWPATDWMEEIMLRTTSLENYDKWTTGELPFSSPEVKHALEVLDELWSDKYVYGGREAIVTTFFGDAPTPMFEDPPKCWLHKQGNFITSFFPEGVEAGTDYDFFYLPPIDEAYGKPYLVAGDIMAMFNDRPEVRAVMEFFTKGEAVKEWLAAGGALSPHKDSELSWYGDDIERGVAELVKAADSVRFDGSDLMPGEVGAGSFWTGMTDYFSGTADADTVLAEIDASWPTGGAAPVEEEEAVEPLIIGTTDSVTDLDPANSYDFHTWEIHHNTMDTLLHYIPGTTDLEPGLAESYEISDDGLEYTFKLREGLSFPDGTAFNADAVVWSINRVMRLEGDPSWLVTSFVDSVEKVDEYTVKFTLQSAVGFFPKVVATQPYSIVSPECYPEDDFDADSTCGGIGPYTIERWERDVEMELMENPGYYGDVAYPHVIVRYFSDSTAMRLALEAGDIDVAWKTLTPSDYKDFEADDNYTLYSAVGPYIRYICFNTTTAPFDNPKVREALSLAINRDQISEVVFQGTHDNLYSMVPKGMFAHVDAFPKRDLAAAVAMLAEAGFNEDNPLVMDLWWTPSHYGPTEGDVASSMKQALEETGVIEVTLQSAEWATYTDYFGPGTMPVFLLGWYPDYLDPDNYTSAFAETDASEDIGIFYSNEDMDNLLVSARTSTDQAEREQLYKDLQELWTTEVPTIPFTQGLLQVVTQNAVEGVKLDATLFLHYFTISK